MLNIQSQGWISHIILSERSWTRKSTCGIIPFIWNFQTAKMNPQLKFRTVAATYGNYRELTGKGTF